ncbi:MAG: hypothetical protein ACI87E_001312 [Mariniblastus sp.]|jgi:hypothetical protein
MFVNYDQGMNPDTRNDYLWLVSDETVPILDHVQKAFEENVNPVRIAKSLRKQTTATRSALVMEQAQLRIRGRIKFANAQQMFFTRRGLEQASGKGLARYKAARMAGLSKVGDLCCGIGGDLLALAQRNKKEPLASETVGIDLDELTCLFAQRNLIANSLDPNLVRIEQVDFNAFDLAGFDGMHVDPDRRIKDRTVHGNRFSPTLEEVFARTPDDCTVAIKVAPATPSANYFPSHLQREWLGDHRECKQQLLWVGPATDKPAHRTATYVGKDGSVNQISVAEDDLDCTIEVHDTILDYIYEPHPAVLAARLTDFVGRRNGLRRFTSGISYLTGKQLVDDPLLTRFEVLDILPLSLRKAHRVLQILEVGEIEVKKRGVESVTVEQFGRMKLEGPNFATVILTRLGKNRVVVIAKRQGNPLELPGISSP